MVLELTRVFILIKRPIFIPVYADLNSIHQVQLYRHTDDGTFRRTGVEPLRMLRDNITGISQRKGELISTHFDREEHEWSSPTIKLNAVHCQSYYRYLRDALPRNQLLVAVAPSMYGQLYKFSLHELTFKSGISPAVLRLIRNRYEEAMDLWADVPAEPDNLVRQLAG